MKRAQKVERDAEALKERTTRNTLQREKKDRKVKALERRRENERQAVIKEREQASKAKASVL